jgi:hypothetical protein
VLEQFDERHRSSSRTTITPQLFQIVTKGPRTNTVLRRCPNYVTRQPKLVNGILVSVGFNQYSSESMIVMTRSVTEGSDGSGDTNGHWD